ncbi:MAG: histidine phosphatase family protein [Lachnospiraceae bacterium]|nr:histidine phosphatase family protein [Lachnospiraceae bacterium]
MNTMNNNECNSLKTTVILIRHGQSTTNLDLVFTGQGDTDLTELGRTQAELLGKWATKEYRIDRIYSSDLKRAYETAKVTADILGLQVERSAALREINCGDWEDVKFEEIRERFSKDYSVWLNRIEDAHCTNGETVREMADRVIREITRIARENTGKTVMIVSHGTPIRAFQARFEKGSIDLMHEVNWVPNASSTECEYRDGGFSFCRIGCTDYLKDAKTTLPRGLV